MSDWLERELEARRQIEKSLRKAERWSRLSMICIGIAFVLQVVALILKLVGH